MKRIVLIILLGVVIFLFFQNNPLKSTIRKEILGSKDSFIQGISNKCADGKYFIFTGDYPFGSDIPEIYDDKLASFLMAVSFNVEISNCSNMGPIPQMEGFNFQLPIYGKTYLGLERMAGYIFHSTKYNTIIIAFTGTFYLDEWLTDSQVEQVPPTELNSYENGVLMHKGFYEFYSSLIKVLHDTIKLLSILNTPKIYITGHSLGGAMATACTYDISSLNPIVYSFASPRVFNPVGVNVYNKNNRSSFRVFNTEDMVTTLPLPIEKDTYYDHVGSGINFTNNLQEIWFNHTLAYLRNYGLAGGNWNPPKN